jgi:L-ascorbate metabolism protein UlaG (beta-lactamase superfamily)
MKLKWLGHACFLITADDGTRILTDPYNAEVGYKVPLEAADYVTVSHEHFDHNSVVNVPGSPQVIKGTGEFELGGVKAFGVATAHDDQGGARRGENVVYCFDFPVGAAATAAMGLGDGALRICHLGDLGHQLKPEQVDAIGDVDVLLVPTGGTYTIDAGGAIDLIRQVKPRVVVPMHYKTDALAFPLSPVTEFTKRLPGADVEFTGQPSVTLDAAEITSLEPSEQPKILVLEYTR